MSTELERLVHDLRHALATVVAASEMLEDELTETGAANPLSAVRAAAFIAARIVDRFPLEQGGAEPSCAAADVVAQAASVFGVVFAPRVAVYSSLSDTGLVAVPRSVLESAVMNLCVNAGAAMASGGTLTIACGPCQVESHERKCVAVSVSDTGLGMSEQQLAAVLSGAARRTRTSGVGLASTMSALRSFGGDLTALSSPGVGTTVCLHLPVLSRTPQPPADPLPRPLVSAPQPVASLSMVARDDTTPLVRPPSLRPVVGVVDDDDVLAEYVAAMIRRAGLEVCMYHSLAELVAATSPLDLVLVDLHLSHADDDEPGCEPDVPGGLGVAAYARSQHGAEVVFTTGDASFAVRALQGEQVLLKPFSRSALLTALRDAFQRRFGPAC